MIISIEFRKIVLVIPNTIQLGRWLTFPDIEDSAYFIASY